METALLDGSSFCSDFLFCSDSLMGNLSENESASHDSATIAVEAF